MSNSVQPVSNHVNEASDVTDVRALEEELARRHGTPKQVEQYGVEAVPKEKRTSGFLELFGIQLSFQINNMTIILPGFAVVEGLNIWAAITSQVIGVGIVFVGYILLAQAGVKYGIPGQVSSRAAFGTLGSRFTASLMRSLASAYWFAWQTIAAAIGMQAILQAWTGTTYSLVPISVTFAIFQAIVALTGWESLKYLTRAVLPIKVILLSVVIATFIISPEPRFAWDTIAGNGSWDWAIIAKWAAIIAGGHITMYTDSADIARYARSAREMMVGFYSAAIISVIFCGFIGAYAAAAIGDANWFAGATVVQPHVWMYLLLLVVLVADNWFINIMNLYTGGFAVVNAFGRIGRFWATVIVAFVGIVLSGFRGVFENTPTIINEIGIAFGPVAGILLAHYVVLCRSRLDLPAIYNSESGAYRYWHGINPVSIGTGLIGYLLARSEVINAAFLPPIAIAVITGILYIAAMKIVALRWKPAADAIDYAAMKDEYSEIDINRSLLRKGER